MYKRVKTPFQYKIFLFVSICFRKKKSEMAEPVLVFGKSYKNGCLKWTLKDVEELSQYIWVFGDNVIRKGELGQACIRKAPNALGIRTKYYPSMKPGSFFTDKEYESNCRMISKDVDEIIEKVMSTNNIEECYEGIVIPKRECWPGTGLARLDECAPKTFNFLCGEMERLQCTIRQWAGVSCPYVHSDCCAVKNKSRLAITPAPMKRIKYTRKRVSFENAD